MRTVNRRHETTTRRRAHKEEALPIHLVRARLMEQRMTVLDWARANGFAKATVTMAMQGRRHGPKSQDIRNRLRSEFAL